MSVPATFARGRVSSTIGFAALLLAVGVSPGVAHAQLYWATNQGTNSRIQTADLDGGNVTTLLSDLGPVIGIALDSADGWLYWTERAPSRIRRMRLDDLVPQDVVTTGLVFPNGIDLDTVHGHMYWVDNATDLIHRANLDGTGMVPLCAGGTDPVNIALDVPNDRMYWTSATDDLLRSANLDCTDVVVLTSGCFGSGGDVAIDGLAGKLWWATECDTIFRADLDGSNRVPVFVSELTRPAMALDPGGELIYWFEWDGRLRRGGYDGSGPTTLLEGVSFVESLAIDPSGAIPVRRATWGALKTGFR